MDLKFIRNNPELAKQIIRRRNESISIDEILQIDEVRRKTIQMRDQLRMEHRRLTEEIAQRKVQQTPVEELIIQAKELADKIRQIEAEVKQKETELEKKLAYVPNVIHESVPNEDTIVKNWGDIPKFSFKPRPHWELGETLDIIDFKRAAKLAGSRFVLFKGPGALLERSLINFCLDVHIKKHGYIEINPPSLNLEICFYNSGALPKLADEMYRCANDPFYLIPTAEVPLVNLHQNECFAEKDLPKYYTAYTPCFRREAGSYGKDVRGMIRIHQFDKVELVKFTVPEQSYHEHEKMREDVEELLQLLELPYRVKLLSPSEMAFQSAKTYDIEVWAAGCEAWLEVSSISNCENFQAKRANIRVRRNNNELEYVHILNGSGLAFPRIFIALIENNQQPDGSVLIPKVLWSYMGGITKIE
ncbi:MAG: serine--tRNA ligase [candidate division WOR-3 bacterium]|nr:serine--tRNA ligase [candidate division WOR-3 bacterium]MCX7757362.1 serine--tRNA ligase [candidate division WOR-3 bacterium]MDW7987488.1 serine--tRNA ligase [candidate division WOR-3 bacterium]